MGDWIWAALGATAGGVAGLALACGPAPFACTDSAQCTRAPGGICEPVGACSYPDGDCPSGRRYSELGSFAAGLCTEPESDEGSTTGTVIAGSSTGDDPVGDTLALDDGGTTDTTVGEDSSGEPPTVCDDVLCSGQGTCVAVDGEATCACDPGWSMVGLQCLEDPCDQSVCYFVDDVAGDDAGLGTRDDPWQTVNRVESALDDALPGDHYLFARGGTFTGGDVLRIDGLDGTEDAPIVIGAYGPVSDPRPQMIALAIEITASSHLVIRDLEIQGLEQSRPCYNFARTDYITVHDNETADCQTRTARVWDGASHTTFFRNTFRDGADKTAVYIADLGWTVPETWVGSHHWIADNVISNNGEAGIDVLIASPELGDVKVVGNQVADIARNGVYVGARFGWVLNNIVVNAGTEDGQVNSGIRVNDGEFLVRGNLVAANDQGLSVTASGEASANTVLQSGNVAFRLQTGPSELHVHDNLVYTVAAASLLVDDATPSPWLSTMDRNVYAGEVADDCVITLGTMDIDFGAWQLATGFDDNGSCEVVPGIANLAPGPQPPFGDEVLGSATAGPAWRQCETVGALDCDGNARPVMFTPHADLPEGEGLGWPGPLLIQQRYPMTP